LAASASFLVSALKRVDLPTLGSPTIPMERLTADKFMGPSDHTRTTAG
jgi:hypothetical protein